MVDVKDKASENLRKYFQVDETKLPFSLLSDFKHKKIFLPDFRDINANKIDQYLWDVKHGKVKQYLKSQEIPKNWNLEPVKILVGKNFEEIVFDVKKHVFVEFYAPSCNQCIQLAPIWDKLAMEFSGVSDLIIAKMDKTLNDVKDIEIKSFPVLKLFLKYSNEVVDFTGPRTKKNLREFLGKYIDLNPITNKIEL